MNKGNGEVDVKKNGSAIKKHYQERLTKKKNKMFAVVLSTIEEEAKRFGVDEKFFDVDNGAGFSRIRNALLDEGNHLVHIMEYLVDFVQGYPSIKFEQGAIKDDNGNASGSNGKETASSGKS